MDSLRILRRTRRHSLPSVKLNYITLYKTSSQVYGTATKSIALESPPPPGCDLEDKVVLFVTYQPDNEVLSVHRLSEEEVQSAEIKLPPSKDKGND